MRLERYQFASTIAMLITCSERLEIENSAHWHTVATAATQLEKLLDGKPADLAEIVASLRKVHADIAAVHSKIAVILNISLAVVEAIHLGLLTLDTQPAKPVFIGFDPASGEDKTAPRCCHA